MDDFEIKKKLCCNLTLFSAILYGKLRMQIVDCVDIITITIPIQSKIFVICTHAPIDPHIQMP